MIVIKKIPTDFICNEISWLGVEKADGGYYLLQYENIDQPCKWDSFYTELEDLIEDCEEWGISKDSWNDLVV